jgi:hypothetical protein
VDRTPARTRRQDRFGEPQETEPQETSELRRDTAVVMVVGELTEPARRPLVRSMTDLLLNVPSLRRSPGTSPPPR